MKNSKNSTVIVTILGILLIAIGGYFYKKSDHAVVSPDITQGDSQATTTIPTQTSPKPAPKPVPARPVTKSPIFDTEWSWKETKLMNGDIIRPQQSEQFVIKFNADKTFTSTTDCNDLIGKFTVNGEVLSIGQIASTKRMCIAATQESEYTQELSRATSFVIKGDELILNLVKDSGTMVFRKHSKDTSQVPNKELVLDGKKFQLVKFNGLDIPVQQKYTLAFADGALSARFCNGLGGSYELKNSTIVATQLMGTLMYCEQPTNIMELEQAFGTTLSVGAKVTLQGDTLTLTGSKAIVFTYTVVE